MSNNHLHGIFEFGTLDYHLKESQDKFSRSSYLPLVLNHSTFKDFLDSKYQSLVGNFRETARRERRSIGLQESNSGSRKRTICVCVCVCKSLFLVNVGFLCG